MIVNKYSNVSLIIIIGCQSTVQTPKPDSESYSAPLVVTKAKSSNEEIETIKKEIQFQTSKIKEIEQKLNTYQTKIIDQSSVIDKNDVNNNELLNLNLLKLIILTSIESFFFFGVHNFCRSTICFFAHSDSHYF